MKKGVVFTMDAVFALYMSFLVMSTLIIILEANTNYSDDSLALTRLAKDVYLVKKYNPALTVPTFLKTDILCDNSKDSIASVQSFAYGDIQNDTWNTKSGVSTTFMKVCYD